MFNPLCLEPAPGEAAHYTPDPNSNEQQELIEPAKSAKEHVASLYHSIDSKIQTS